jgi:hypothetical protein
MKKYTVKNNGKYWTRNGASEGFLAPGIAGCYSYPLAGALWVKAHKGGEVVALAKDGSGRTVEGEPWDGRLLILAPLVPTTIVEGSGIVGVELDEKSYTVYYEGNIYNAACLAKWEHRVKHAADRLLHAYPTVARGAFLKGAFKVIGYYCVGKHGHWMELAEKFQLIGPDNIPLTPEPFDSREEAEAYIPKWVELYRKQGYYSTADGHRIPVDELANRIKLETINEENS